MAEEQQAKPKGQEGRKASEAISIVRLAGRDIDGRLPVFRALRQIKGIGQGMANAMAEATERSQGISRVKQIGALSEEEMAKLESVIRSPEKFGVPQFMLNRQKDAEANASIHVVGTDLVIKTRQDMDNSIKQQTWIGFRRQYGQKVRGQRTRATGRTGETVGVAKKKVEEAEKAARAPKGAAGPAKPGTAPAGAAPGAPAAGAPAAEAAPKAAAKQEQK
jgi:small subunit ribosomal protein S13